jgi:hypothetical protein
MTFEGGSRSNEHSLLDLTYRLKIRRKLEAWILKLGGVLLLSYKIWWESSVALAPLQFLIPWTQILV